MKSETRVRTEELPSKQADTISNEVYENFTYLADELSGLHGRIGSLLEPICRETSVPEKEEEETAREDYPPYFAMLRDVANRIHREIRNINQVLDRVVF
jgi:hypothetical protein